MILKGNQRAGGEQLARHLLNVRDNDHVTVHQIRGFISENLSDALAEAYAVSLGTKCKQFLFSLSLNPPEKERVTIDVFEKAIAKVENRLGLDNQPRAIIFHEKEGRRHAHCVWSRIDIDKMKAINLPHYKMKLYDIARDLYLEHEWKIPNGFLKKEDRNPLNFTLAEWQRAKRANQDPKLIKALIQGCWEASDSSQSFSNALKQRGFFLAKGNRRGHVIVDWRGEVFAVSRMLGVKTKAVNAKLCDPENLPTVSDVQNDIASKMSAKFKEYSDQVDSAQDKAKSLLNAKRRLLVTKLRAERHRLKKQHLERKTEETRLRAQKLPNGLKALWFRITGQYKAIKQENEAEANACNARDQSEMQTLIETQLAVRRQLQHEYQTLQHHYNIRIQKLNRDIGVFLSSAQSDKEDAFALETEQSQTLRHRKPSRSHQ